MTEDCRSQQYYNAIKDPVTVPLSPTAANLGKFVQTPVGSYTGIPEIAIPIWEIRYGNIVMPLNLQYHAGGIKVDELSSNVGLGWSLTNMPNISRVVRGLKDGGYNYSKIESLRNNQLTSSETVEYVIDVMDGVTDAERDLYILSYPGLSCQFIEDKNGQFVTIPKDKRLAINKISDFEWQITDDTGTKYTFRESTHSENLTTISYGYGNVNELGQENSVNTWYLTKIQDNLNRTIAFEYNSVQYSVDNKAIEGVKVFDPGSSCGNSIEFFGVTNFTQYTEPVVNVITYGNTSIRFNYQDQTRLDLPGAFAMDRITVTSGNDIIKSFDFYYSYFQNSNVGTTGGRYYAFKDEDKYRLKLDSLVERNETERMPAYQFHYSGPQLPYRLSNAQDHWGYFNGKNNTDFVSYRRDGTILGGNKNIDNNFSSACILNRIKYPAGSEVLYEYEGNQLPGTLESREVTVARIYRDNATKGDEKEIYEISETVDLTTDVTGGSIYIKPIVTIEGFSAQEDDSYEISMVRAGDTPIKIIRSGPFMFIPAGVYTVKLTIYSPADPGNANFVSVNLDIVTRKTFKRDYTDAPGIRVRKITNSDGRGQTMVGEYTYTLPDSNQSSGILGTDFSGDATSYEISDQRVIRASHGSIVNCTYDLFNSVSNYPLINSNGGYVGYSFVTTTESDGTNSRKTVTNYSNHDRFSDIVSGTIPIGPNSTQGYKRGLIKTLEIYETKNGEFVLKESRVNTYRKVAGSETYIYGIKASESTEKGPYNLLPSTRFANSSVNIYQNYSDSFKLVADTVTTIENGVRVVEVNNYRYNDKYLLEGIEYSGSRGEIYTQETKYPSDYSDPIYAAMQQSNILSTIVEESRQIGNSTSTLKNIFSQRILDGKAQFLTSSTTSFINDNVNKKILMSYYDIYGNPQQVRRQDNAITCYLWGYDGQYPVAKIENATYQEVLGILGQTKINSLNAANVSDETVREIVNSLRNHANMRKAQISTYTYKPLVGMTSITDPRGTTEYYLYDGFQRLKHVLDFEANVLQDYRYNYKK
ncbi:hypothetical protein HP439_18170 [Sphingobacterium shayense]|uniref:hypothetical protein n=1 Tax=Sphingobacterium shayense TaxID=626343 RepID=UPI001553F8CB|nr:hypothetical protein [Sphingobacterium shayense]NQD72655.1 hypothetical protein [Sphingobacterium shayense]